MDRVKMHFTLSEIIENIKESMKQIKVKHLSDNNREVFHIIAPLHSWIKASKSIDRYLYELNQ